MPWEKKTVEKSRMEFVSEVMRREDSISEICRKYGITRKTGYKWIERFQSGESLDNKSHVPFHTPHKTPQAMEEIILQLRDEHPSWGGRKLKRRLEDLGYTDLPAVSTICEILKRTNRIDPEESEKHTPFIRFEYPNPNDLWQMDYKGYFNMLDGNRCNPLTITDDHSRFNLCLDAKENQNTEVTKSSLERVFSEYGLPEKILCDNGPPWRDSKGGYTLLEMWFMQLGILPVHGRPCHPQTQGKEERFHKTMIDEILKFTVIRDIHHAKEVFEPWRYEYNYERPHGSLAMDTPSKHYCKSKRLYTPQMIKEPEYGSGINLRKINCKGYLSIRRKRYYFSETFIGKTIELKERENHLTDVLYGNFNIAIIDLREQRIISRKIMRVDAER